MGGLNYGRGGPEEIHLRVELEGGFGSEILFQYLYNFFGEDCLFYLCSYYIMQVVVVSVIRC